MDESEILIARAALAAPPEAVAAWTQWRATNSIEDASALLSWAGGYIHRNLQAAGVNDAYLAGIYRFNWIANNRRVVGALETIREISRRWPITPLKSFGMSEEVYSRGLRPLADFDFYADVAYATEIKQLLEHRQFRALDGLTAGEFSSRVIPQRGSWNFKDDTHIDLDLHWRLLEHLDVTTSERLVTANSRLADTEFGTVRQLVPELMLVTLAVHHCLQPSGPLNGVFDFFHLLPNVDPVRAARLAKSIGVSREVASVAALSRSLAGDGDHPHLSDLGRALAHDARRQPATDSVRRVLPLFETLPDRYNDPKRLTTPRLYRLWSRLGRPGWLERSLIRRFGSISRTSSADGGDQFPAVGGMLGPGWHYRYPDQPFRWADVPDARVTFGSPPSGPRTLRLVLDKEKWAVGPIASFDVFAQGRRLGRCDKSASTFEFELPEGTAQVEVSLRQHGLSRYTRPGMRAEWFRMLAPVTSIELLPDGDVAR